MLGNCHGPAGVPRLATRCLCVLSTWLVVCLVPCAPMSIVCPLPSCYLIISVSVAPAVSLSLPSFVSLYSLLVSAVLCWSVVFRVSYVVSVSCWLCSSLMPACLLVFPLRGGFCSSLVYFIIKRNNSLHLSPRPHLTWQNGSAKMRTQQRRGLGRPPPDTISSPLYQRILQYEALSSCRQQGNDVRSFAVEFSGAAEGLGYNDEALKDLFNSALDEPLSWWRMSGLDHLTFGEFVEALARSPAKVAGVPQVVGDKAAAAPVAADGAAVPLMAAVKAAAHPRLPRLVRKLEDSPMRSVRAADSSPTKPSPVVLEAMVERARSAPEPAPIREPTYSAPEPAESAPEPAPIREPKESAPESAPIREPTESAPIREPTHSAPIQEPTHSAPEPAPIREPTESAPEPAPIREPKESVPEPAPIREPTESRSGSPRIPLRSGSPRIPLRSGSPRIPLRSGSPRIPLRSGSPRSPDPGAHAFSSSPGAHAFRSDPGAHAFRSDPGAHGVRSRARSGLGAHAFRSGLGAHAFCSGPAAQGVRSRARSAPWADRVHSRARSAPWADRARSVPGAHAVRSIPGAHAVRSVPGAHAVRSRARSAPWADRARSVPGAHAVRTIPGAHTVRSVPGAHAVRSRARSVPGANAVRSRARSVPGAHAVRSRARSSQGAHRLRSRARSGLGAHAVHSGPGPRSGLGTHRARSRASPTLAPLCAHCSRPSSTPRAWPTSLLDIFLFSVCGASGIHSLKGGLCHGPAGVPRLATRCLCVLSTWLVVSPPILLLNHCFSGSSCVSLVTLVCLTI